MTDTVCEVEGKRGCADFFFPSEYFIAQRLVKCIP